jgi:hypothetical protein
MQSKEEAILAFRKAYLNLPDDVKEKEVLRVYNAVKGRRFVVLEDHDIGKVIKFLNVPSLQEYLWREKQLRSDRSYVYKVLRGQYQNLYGYNIYYEEIE